MQIISGCVLTVLPTLEGGSVHQCVTSVPYFNLREYPIPDSDWPAVSYAPLPGMPEIEVPAWTGQLGAEPEIEMYVGHLVHVFRLVWRVLRDDGTLWLNLGDSFCGGGASSGFHKQHAEHLGYQTNTRRAGGSPGLKAKDLMMIPARVALALQADGWYLRSEIIWGKGVSFCESYAGSVMPESVTDRPTRAHEQVYLLTKKAKYYYDAEAVRERLAYAPGRRVEWEQNGSVDKRTNGPKSGGFPNDSGGRNLRSVWLINTKPSKNAHFAGWPPRLVAPMIKAGTSERGVCPSCGSPWERVVEKTATGRTRERSGGGLGTERRRESHGLAPVGGQFQEGVVTKTTGWRPTCSCYDFFYYRDLPQSRKLKRRHWWFEQQWFKRVRRRGLTEYDTRALNIEPAMVLDPFMGTGVALKTARDLGRHAIGIDAAPDYVQMAHQKTAQQHLF